jgi:hypothetical protein
MGLNERPPQKVRSMKHYVLGVFILVSCFAACGERIPAEAPALSEQLGLEIESVRKSHVSAIQQVFALKRDEVNRFYSETWLPVFADAYFKSDAIKEARDWVTSCPSLTAAEHKEAEAQAKRKINCRDEMLQFVVRSGPVLQKEMEQQKAAIIAPLDELERALLGTLEAKYAEVKAINTSITAFLFSAAEVTATRDRYLKKAGVTDAKIDEAVTRVDGIVSEFLSAAKKVEERAEPAKTYRDKLNTLLQDLKK